MSGLGPNARTILESARNFDDPSDEECARVRRSVLAVAVVGAAPLAAWSTAAAAALKVVLPIALVVAGGAGVWRYARHGSVEVMEPIRKQVSVLASSSNASVSLAAPSPTPDVGKSIDVARARRATPAGPRGRLEEETRLLGQVNESLRAGDPAGAQALLDDYERRFPSGVLREEMQATRVIARCQATRSPFAREAARQFLVQHPASPLASRVGGSCDLPGR
jgi:hypothetical protein